MLAAEEPDLSGTAVRVAVPGGLWPEPSDDFGEGPVRELFLRAVTAEDEIFVLDTVAGARPSERATLLLARCLPDGEVIAPSLAVGDRDALLLHLRRLTIGETFDCALRCSGEGCGQAMDLALTVGDLLVPPYPDARDRYALDLDNAGYRWELSFRVPTAGDVDNATSRSSLDPEGCAVEILQACLLEARRDGETVDVGQLPDAVRAAIAAAMAERDPQAEIELQGTCPACGAAFATFFDAASYVLQELEERAGRLLWEVHTLARQYHWSEKEILGLSVTRRAHYLGLIARSQEPSPG